MPEDKATALSDATSLAHDCKLYPIPMNNYKGELQWEDSQAQCFLKSTIVGGAHLKMSPLEFDRQEPFKEYSEDIIREHIYQEVKFEKYCLYRKEKNKTKVVEFSS